MTYKIFNENVTEWEWDGEPFHAMLCDPPYHMTTITKRFGKKDSAPAKYGSDGLFQRASKGFMGQEWDGGDVAFRPETWYHLGQFLYDGAFGMAFASARGYHRMAVAIEDAGFVIHPSIFWVYGSGFPKATRLDKQIDKMLGKEQEIVGKRLHPTLKDKSKVERSNTQNFGGNPTKDEWDITEPATELAQAWEGHRYGLQALKPAAEPIIIFQKPYVGKPVENMVETGAGALNIEGGRIGEEQRTYTGTGAQPNKLMNHKRGDTGIGYADGHSKDVKYQAQGRWPANFLMTHSVDCQITGYKDGDDYTINRFDDGMKPFGNGAGHDYNSEEIKAGKIAVWECVDGCPARAMDGQSGIRKTTWVSTNHQNNRSGEFLGELKHPGNQGYNDKGGASRFFHQSGWQLEQTDPFLYQAKANKKERNAGLEGEEKRTSEEYLPNDDGTKGIQSRLHGATSKGVNSHPTVKPLDLTKYLASILLPPDMYAPRRVLIPFSGAASEMIGAHMAGWEEIIGIEITPEYVEIAEARMKHWCGKPQQLPLI